jgi:2-methylcitrate dehydratase PrpD
MSDRGPIAAALAAFTLSGAPREPGAPRAAARRHLLDVVGCGLAAVGTNAGAHAGRVAAAAGGAQEATVLGIERRLPAASAALANGTRFHALDFDDTHEAGICHVSAVVAPAALAVGEAVRATGAEVVDAYLAGSEVALRIAVAAAPGLYARGFHPTSVCGAFGAAAAAARLRGLSAAEATSALGIVGSFASGLFAYLSDGSATKPLHAGWAAQAGVQAAALAAEGATGPATVLEGRFGLLASHTDAVVGLDDVTRDLGTRWEIGRVALKPYPACHFLHAATWACGRLADDHRLAPEDVAHIDVRVAAEGVALVLDPLDGKHRPSTPYDAKFSAPFTIAHQLVHGQVDLRSFSEERIRDPAVLALARRVDGGPWEPGEPPSRFAAAVAIATQDGRDLRLEVPHTPGSPGNPMDATALRSKFRANAAMALGPAEVEAIIQALEAIDAPVAVGELLTPLRRAGAREQVQPCTTPAPSGRRRARGCP